jgi:hypothetical protein
MGITRRGFLQIAAALGSSSAVRADGQRQSLRNAVEIGNRLVVWQGPYGGPDPVKCPYRTPGKFSAYSLHGVGPSCRALYRLFDATGVPDYKVAADRYATFLMNTLHEPPPKDVKRLTINGVERVPLSSAWMFGKALSPCYEWFVTHNPREDAYELKAHALYRWLQRHRNPESYFGVGYPCNKYPDAQFSCDLGEVGGGLVGFYNVSGHKPALEDATGLAKYFLTDYQEGTGRGVWSPKLGTWLVGPWPGGGAEHFTGQVYNQTGWGWSCLVAGEFLLALRRHLKDEGTRAAVAARCVSAWRWTIDACQFPDGAHGMFGRDDRWVGMTAVPVLLYAQLKAQGAIPAKIDAAYRPKTEKAWRWLVAHTTRETFPPDGYIQVKGTTSKKPLENLVWLLAWTLEALLEGGKVFGG